MSLENATRDVQQKMALAAGLKAKVKFNFGPEGVICVDTTQTPPVISNQDQGEADVVLSCSLPVFADILAGTQNANLAFMMGKLKIKGSMGLAMKLGEILED